MRTNPRRGTDIILLTRHIFNTAHASGFYFFETVSVLEPLPFLELATSGQIAFTDAGSNGHSPLVMATNSRWRVTSDRFHFLVTTSV